MKAIITDLDRTLLHTDKSLSEYTIDILKSCHEKGFLIMAATARPERSIFPKLPTQGILYKILASSKHDDIFQIIENALTHDTYCTVANNNLIQIMGRNATKWNGIKVMLEAMGISPNETIYFGDDNDDIEPIEKCGIGVAVSNAIEAVKGVADYIADSNDNDGVARYIERNILL